METAEGWDAMVGGADKPLPAIWTPVPMTLPSPPPPPQPANVPSAVNTHTTIIILSELNI